MASPLMPVSFEDVLAARELLEGVVRPTPLEYSRALSDRAGVEVFLKCENLQRAGSFKIRGAYTRMSRLSDEEKARGVVAASAGNHAQGVALAAQLLGIRSTVFMPLGAPLPKLVATRAYGAHVEQIGRNIDDCLVRAREFAAETGAVLIHPFDHPDIVAGQGTCGLEILEQCPDVRTILVSGGGGGLMAGIATAVKAKRPDVRVVGVQAETAAAYPASLAAGEPVQLASMSTMADGIAVGLPGCVPYAIVRELVDGIRRSARSLSRALLFLLERAKLVVEPAGAAAVARLLDAGSGAFEGPVVAVLSRRQHRPAAAAADHPARHGRGRALPAVPRARARQPGVLARLLAAWPRPTPTSWRSSTSAPARALRVDEVELGCSWRPRARSTARSCSGHACAARATTSLVFSLIQATRNIALGVRCRWRRVTGVTRNVDRATQIDAGASPRPGEALRRRQGASTASTCGCRRAPCWGCSAPTAPARRRPSAILTTLLRPDAGRAEVAGIDVLADPRRGAPPDRAVRAVRRRRRVPHRLREPRHGRPALPPGPAAQPGAGRASCWSSSDLDGRGRPAGQDLLRRHAPPARPGRRAGRRPAGAVPRRADHRPRPAQPHRDVGRHPGAGRRRHHAAAHHPVPRGGRPARRRHRRDRPRPGHRPGHRRRSSRRRSAASGSRSPSRDRGAARPRPASCSRRSASGDGHGRGAPPLATVPVTGGAAVLVDALRRLDAAAIAVDDVGLRRPTLDDVFLTLTGHAAEDDGRRDAGRPGDRRRGDERR